MKKLLAIMMMCVWVNAPFVYAQETVSMPAPDVPAQANADTAANIADAPATVQETLPDTAANLVDITIQDATTTQQTVTPETLVQTADPQAASTTPAVEVSAESPVVNEATSTETVIVTETVSQEPVVQDAVPVVNDVPLTVVQENLPAQQTQTAQLQNEPPKPSYAFALTGARVPVREKDAAHATTLQATADNAKGELVISGACADVYYVVLIFKNKDDYAKDPRSYIVNRAYPCEGGAFSYSISDLPETLPGGTYYVMVGQEGQHGGWKPITDLSEITINRN